MSMVVFGSPIQPQDLHNKTGPNCERCNTPPSLLQTVDGPHHGRIQQTETKLTPYSRIDHASHKYNLKDKKGMAWKYTAKYAIAMHYQWESGGSATIPVEFVNIGVSMMHQLLFELAYEVVDEISGVTPFCDCEYATNRTWFKRTEYKRTCQCCEQFGKRTLKRYDRRAGSGIEPCPNKKEYHNIPKACEE